MYRLIIGTALVGLLQTPVLAGNFDISAPSSAESNTNTEVDVGNTQRNDNATVQNNSGSVSNVAVQNTNLGNFTFGPGISCATPGLAINAYGDSSSYGHNSTGATVSYLMPLGGSVGSACKRMVNEIAKQKALDTQINLIKVCVDLKKNGIEVNQDQYPEIATACKGVRIVAK